MYFIKHVYRNWKPSFQWSSNVLARVVAAHTILTGPVCFVRCSIKISSNDQFLSMTLLELMGSLDPLDTTLLSSYDTTGPVLSVPVLIDPYGGEGSFKTSLCIFTVSEMRLPW